jgi:hypothetical protein
MSSKEYMHEINRLVGERDTLSGTVAQQRVEIERLEIQLAKTAATALQARRALGAALNWIQMDEPKSPREGVTYYLTGKLEEVTNELIANLGPDDVSRT